MMAPGADPTRITWGFLAKYSTAGALVFTTYLGGDGHYIVYTIDGLGCSVATIVNYQTGSSSAPNKDLVTQVAYDGSGRTIKAMNALGKVPVYTYDLRDHLLQVQENVQTGTCTNAPCNVLTRYQYDRAGNLSAITRRQQSYAPIYV